MTNECSNATRLIPRCVWALCALAAVAMSPAHAHSVWIEPLKGQLVIRFAEPDGTLEKSPGYLDNLSLPLAFNWAAGSPQSVEASKASPIASAAAVEVTKKPNHFLIGGVTPADTVCAETCFTVRAERKPNFYARWQPAGAVAATPLLTMDLVPTGKAGEVRAYFRGKPLGGIKAALHAPDGTETELTADAEGLLQFSADKPGQYLLTIAHHREPLAGFHQGVAYKETSHNCSLVWVQPDTEQKKP